MKPTSHQTSLAAMGKTYEGIVDETVDILMEGMDKRLRERKKKLQERRRRYGH